jgi:hypothetical protein
VGNGPPQTVSLPAKCDVFDLFANRLVGKQIDRFEVSAPRGRTLLYFTGDYRELRSCLNQR